MRTRSGQGVDGPGTSMVIDSAKTGRNSQMNGDHGRPPGVSRRSRVTTTSFSDLRVVIPNVANHRHSED